MAETKYNHTCECQINHSISETDGITGMVMVLFSKLSRHMPSSVRLVMGSWSCTTMTWLTMWKGLVTATIITLTSSWHLHILVTIRKKNNQEARKQEDNCHHSQREDDSKGTERATSFYLGRTKRRRKCTLRSHLSRSTIPFHQRCRRRGLQGELTWHWSRRTRTVTDSIAGMVVVKKQIWHTAKGWIIRQFRVKGQHP